eukprot:CAMPEP_0185022720 /NCGR_PEP_ID=MMETSP1103-20130426/5425_1 /TAXON_ID=36769 /ORGANISM="Paraphysomonas bandaiensis, Strain Caron Lab Isolate" /LENGTH=682 /DNA_ID=CAMNT_0027554931 /DNA_START=331 /DNA_END=2379 /DNA_ORIENTATION=+
MEHGVTKTLDFMLRNTNTGTISLTTFYYQFPIDIDNFNSSDQTSIDRERKFIQEYTFLRSRRLNWGPKRLSTWNTKTEHLLDEDESIPVAYNDSKKSSKKKSAHSQRSNDRVKKCSTSPKLRKTTFSVWHTGAPELRQPAHAEDKLLYKLHLAEERRLHMLRQVKQAAHKRNLKVDKQIQRIKYQKGHQSMSEERLRKILQKKEEEIKYLERELKYSKQTSGSVNEYGRRNVLRHRNITPSRDLKSTSETSSIGRMEFRSMYRAEANKPKQTRYRHGKGHTPSLSRKESRKSKKSASSHYHDATSHQTYKNRARTSFHSKVDRERQAKSVLDLVKLSESALQHAKSTLSSKSSGSSSSSSDEFGLLNLDSSSLNSGSLMQKIHDMRQSMSQNTKDIPRHDSRPKFHKRDSDVEKNYQNSESSARADVWNLSLGNGLHSNEGDASRESHSNNGQTSLLDPEFDTKQQHCVEGSEPLTASELTADPIQHLSSECEPDGLLDPASQRVDDLKGYSKCGATSIEVNRAPIQINLSAGDIGKDIDTIASAVQILEHRLSALMDSDRNLVGHEGDMSVPSDMSRSNKEKHREDGWKLDNELMALQRRLENLQKYKITSSLSRSQANELDLTDYIAGAASESSKQSSDHARSTGVLNGSDDTPQIGLWECVSSDEEDDSIWPIDSHMTV